MDLAITDSNFDMLHAKRFLQLLRLITSVFIINTYCVYSQAEGGVHFGSIFVEDSHLSKEESKKSLNFLTDQDQKQKSLEEIHPELQKQNHDMRQLSSEPTRQLNPAPAPHSTQPSAYAAPEAKLGVIRNDEIKQRVIYFIELRPIPGNQPKDAFANPNTMGRPHVKIQPGELVKVIDSPDEYIQKMRMDRDSQGVWKRIARRSDYDPMDLYTYYDWRNYESISPMETAVEMDILVPRDMSSIPVFSQPGYWTHKDCYLSQGLCLDRIDQHTKAFLFDTAFAVVNEIRTQQSNLQLYYKIGYKVVDKEGRVQHKIGWIPSVYARRKITLLPKNMITNNEFGLGFESDEERLLRLQKHYVFKENMFSENKVNNRWLKEQPGQKGEVFDQTFAFDAVFGMSQFTLDQTFLNDTFNQIGALVGFGIYVPIYVDLEVQGTFSISIPLSSKPQLAPFESTPLFRGDQWLVYTTPLGIDKLPLKFAVGGYYLSMFQDGLNFGFKSFIGFQGKFILENDHFWVDARFGPTGQDFNFNLENRELGASFGIRLDPSSAFDSWTVFGDYGRTTYKSPVSGQTTEFDILQLGLRKTF